MVCATHHTSSVWLSHQLEQKQKRVPWQLHSLLGHASSVQLLSCPGDYLKSLGKYIKVAMSIISCKINYGGGYVRWMGKVRRQNLPPIISDCSKGASSQYCPLSSILRAFVQGGQALVEKRWAMEVESFCEVPGFQSLPLELLHFVQAIKYSLGQGEKSKRLSLLPSCSGAHLGCERCRVKSLLQRWFNYSYKVEQLQQEGGTCQQDWWPSPVLHKTSSLLTGVGWLDACFLLAKRMFPVFIIIC